MTNNKNNMNELVSDTEPRPELQSKLDAVLAENSRLRAEISALHDTHAAEIRMIRFELGDAQETLTQREMLAEKLASDLLETRSHRARLETRLATSKENRNAEIARLKRQKRQLFEETEILNEKLRSKSKSINTLLAELARYADEPRVGSIIDKISPEVNHISADTVEDAPFSGSGRVTRYLIGTVGGKDLRFPLFKNRLTIGRTPQNDIQLETELTSQRHAVVVTEGDYTRIIDWGSRNGVFVNSRQVKEHFLTSGDVVTVGSIDFRYEERRKRD